MSTKPSSIFSRDGGADGQRCRPQSRLRGALRELPLNDGGGKPSRPRIWRRTTAQLSRPAADGIGEIMRMDRAIPSLLELNIEMDIHFTQDNAR